MPVVRAHQQRFDDARPPWCDLTAAGIFRVPRNGGRFDQHYHDCDEYWLIYAGRAKVLSEGRTYYVAAGDIVCTQTGEEHDVVEVYEDLEGFFVENALHPGGAAGHLHHTPEAAGGHAVPALPVPDDFPTT